MSILGGFCTLSAHKLQNIIAGLSAHTQVRVESTFHFIDAWAGESAYLRVSPTDDYGELAYVWTDTFDFTTSKNERNICGGEVAEARFAVPIDVSFPHNDSSVKLEFGSTLGQDPCYASWGISSVRVSVR